LLQKGLTQTTLLILNSLIDSLTISASILKKSKKKARSFSKRMRKKKIKRQKITSGISILINKCVMHLTILDFTKEALMLALQPRISRKFLSKIFLEAITPGVQIKIKTQCKKS